MAKPLPIIGRNGIQRLLAILIDPETAPSVLALAALLQARLPGSRLDLLRPRSAVDPSFMPTEEVWTEPRRLTFEAESNAVLASLQTIVAARPGSGAAPTLREVVGKVGEVVAAAAAGADLLVLGAVRSRRELEAAEAIHAALFEASAAVLLAPYHAPTVLGERVAVAWERSDAAEGAVAAALPVLLRAREVFVLVAREGHNRAAMPQELLAALQTGAISTTIRHFGLEGRDIGEALLAEALNAGADLMVMGAFTHNRVLEALFGGATHEVLGGATLPLLLHH